MPGGNSKRIGVLAADGSFHSHSPIIRNSSPWMEYCKVCFANNRSIPHCLGYSIVCPRPALVPRSIEKVILS